MALSKETVCLKELGQKVDWSQTKFTPPPLQIKWKLPNVRRSTVHMYTVA